MLPEIIVCAHTVTVDKELYEHATGRSLKQGTWSTVTLKCVMLLNGKNSIVCIMCSRDVSESDVIIFFFDKQLDNPV